MARPSVTVLKRVEVMEAPAKADVRPVMLVPTGSAEEWQRLARIQQAELYARSADDRRE